MRRIALCVIASVVVLGCGGLGEPGVEGWLLAQIQPAEASDTVLRYSGNARFSITPVTPRDGLPLTQLFSQNRPNVGLPTEGYESLGFEAWRKLPAGSYAVGDRGSVFSDPDFVWLTYQRAVNDSIETYSAVSGSLTITHSSSERLEGTFRFEALRYCHVSQDPDAPREDPCDVWTLDSSSPRISVEGSFEAGRLRLDDQSAPDQGAGR